ncbi:hypothetical protein N0V82_009366 [Gnomoniopsis sp. IMI 355080]|nr:hypothetical protein N0V82_009366 [Gnomoniopsis sp. IMI 355080]
MSSTTKWDDAAVKDLTMAVLMSANNGDLNISANWDKVTETMASWGYNFSKSAMSQHWSKKIVKQFKERHSNVKGSDNGTASPKTPAKTASPRKRATPKTPGTGRGKKRAAVDADDDGDDTSPETSYIADPIAKQKTPRSTKKVKYEEESDNDSEAKAGALNMDEDVVELGEEMEIASDSKAKQEVSGFYAV